MGFRSRFSGFNRYPVFLLRRLVFWVGAVVVSLAAIGFARAADIADNAFHLVLLLFPAAPLLLGPLGFMLSVALTRSVFPGAQGSGIPQVIASLDIEDPAKVRRVLSLRIAAGKVLLTVLGLASGASIGREGPTVQLGAAMMRAFGGWISPGAAEQRALVLAGGAAGIAAAFNTPLAGVVFAIEELSHSFESRASGTVLTAVIVSGIATVAIMGNYNYFGTSSASLPVGIAWEAVVACGVLGGLAGGLFAQILIVFSRYPGRVGRRIKQHPIVFAGVCGLAVGYIGIVSGGVTFGTGYAQARDMVAGHSHLPIQFFALKFVASVASYVSGMPGGIFAPSLAVGAGLGRWIAHFLPSAPPGAVVLLGMVGYFTGAVQAPITGAVIVMEMTDNQGMTIPLMAASLLGFLASRLICPRPLYSTLSAAFLASVEGPAQTAVSALRLDEARAKDITAD